MSFENLPIWKKVWREYTARLERLGIRWGLLNESNSLTPFVIFTYQRFGSNMLVSMLNHHPQIRCFGEIFSFKEQLLLNIDGFRRLNKDKNLLRLRAKNPEGFVSKIIKRLHPKRIKSCGFKLFYNQPRTDRHKFLKHLIAEDFKVIHLKRDNLLASYTSKQIALSTGVWVGRSDCSTPKIHIDKDEFETYLYQMSYHDDEIKELVSPERLLEATYEELTAGNRITEIQQFLGVKPQKIISKTEKQRKRTLPELIENYEELKYHYSGREEQKFFE